MDIAKKDENIQVNTNLFTFIRLLNSMLYFNEALMTYFLLYMIIMTALMFSEIALNRKYIVADLMAIHTYFKRWLIHTNSYDLTRTKFINFLLILRILRVAQFVWICTNYLHLSGP